MNSLSINEEERVAKARSFFRKGYNCCQSVALAYSDVIAGSLGLDVDGADGVIAALTSGFGGGVGRMREVCGCVSGMAFVAGAVCPSTDPGDHAGRTANYALVQSLAGEYRAINGSVVCRELLGLDGPRVQESPEPSVRTAEYYRKRPCEELVGIAAGILARRLSAPAVAK